ncbi:MAG: protein kinase [Pyrinomonadaceae bacterium]|nr:protein kinase [Pyrinomonadaceae bacterium]
MKTSDWQKLKEVFNATLDLPENERAEFLAKYDEDLRREAQKLLNANENAQDFIAESAFVDIGFTDQTETDFYLGKQIDDYNILEEIGHGGMGTVYRASRSGESFDKNFAIKLIKRGMDTNAVLKRFMLERKILAQLENPNIASLIDGGSTAEGLPYLVMEYIEGEPITKFCDSHQFSIEERLELFRKVCAAVSYAHQNLVIHRDLKPSNILVTKDGTPKLLDFGIAKLLHPEWSADTAEATATMFRLMTPEYASPEQIGGKKITTASDVYSLGVILFELLKGTRPAGAGSGQWAAGRNTDENKIETTHEKNQRSKTKDQRPLNFDLENIIQKSLREEPERRYQTVQEFSEDIRRHLIGLPVTATADTAFYRLGKFVKRHRAGVFAGVFMILSLLMGTSVAIWQAVEARKERVKAEQRFNDVRKLTNSFLFDFHDAIQDLQGATPAREMTVKKALEYLDILAQEQSNDTSLQFELAVAYSKVANIQGSPGASNLGDTAGAVASYQKAIEILEKLVQIEPKNREFQKALALNYKSTAFIYENMGDSDLNFSSNQSALNLFQNLVVSDETDFDSKLELADCFKSLGDLIASKGNLAEALQNYQKKLEISESVLRSQPENKKAKQGIMVACDAIGTTLGNPNFTNLGDTDGALQAYQRQLEIGNEMLRTDEKSQTLQATKAFTLKVIGEVQSARGEWKEAIQNYRQALEIQEKLVQNDAKDAFAGTRLAYLLTNLGEALANTNQLAEALNYHHRAVEILEKLVANDKENSAIILWLNRAYQKKGDALVMAGQPAEALNFYHRALKSNEEIAAQDLNNMDMRLQLANDYLQIGRANVILANKTSAKKQEFLSEARKRFEQSKAVFLDMQSHNLRTKPINESLTKISQEIAKCDAELAKL